MTSTYCKAHCNATRGWHRSILQTIAVFLALFTSACTLADLSADKLVTEAQAAYDTERYEAALVAYQKAAQAGSSVAMFQLGAMAERGQGAAADFARAAFWYQRAADAGSVAAMKRLGNLYLDGQGVPKSADKAAALYERAGKAGDANSLFLLGQLWWNGSLGASDPGKAVAAFKEASRMGDGKSINALGIAYRLGEGVVKDDALAFAHFRLASERDIPAARVNAEELATKMSPADIARGDLELARLRSELSLK